MRIQKLAKVAFVLATFVVASSAWALPMLDIVVKDAGKKRVKIDVRFGTPPSQQCASSGAGCLTSLSLDLTAGAGETNAFWKTHTAKIVSTSGVPSDHIEISYSRNEATGPNVPKGKANVLTFDFDPVSTLDPGNSFILSVVLENLGGNDAEDFARNGKEVGAYATLGDGTKGEALFSRAKHGSIARIEFDGYTSPAVPEPTAALVFGLGITVVASKRGRQR